MLRESILSEKSRVAGTGQSRKRDQGEGMLGSEIESTGTSSGKV